MNLKVTYITLNNTMGTILVITTVQQLENNSFQNASLKIFIRIKS